MTLHQQASARHKTIKNWHGCRTLDLTIRRALSEGANIGPWIKCDWFMRVGWAYAVHSCPYPSIGRVVTSGGRDKDHIPPRWGQCNNSIIQVKAPARP